MRGWEVIGETYSRIPPREQDIQQLSPQLLRIPRLLRQFMHKDIFLLLPPFRSLFNLPRTSLQSSINIRPHKIIHNLVVDFILLGIIPPMKVTQFEFRRHVGLRLIEIHTESFLIAGLVRLYDLSVTALGDLAVDGFAEEEFRRSVDC